ncbi:MAG TPA: hypothetical protein VH760_09990 [Gaiellaceae bacterium]
MHDSIVADGAGEYDGTTASPTKKQWALAVAAVAIAAGVGLAVWAAGRDHGSKRPSGDAVVFLRGIVSQIADNDYAGVWPSLHPVQQRVATRSTYVTCEALTPIPGHLDWVRLVRRKIERITVPGDRGVVDSEAVTFRVKLSEPVLKQSVIVTQTVHAVAVDGRWRWILSPKRFGIYRSKACPSAESPSTGA